MYSDGCKPDKGTGTEKRHQAEQKLRAAGDIITAASRIKVMGREGMTTGWTKVMGKRYDDF